MGWLLPNGLDVERLGIDFTHFHVARSARTHSAGSIQKLELQGAAQAGLQPVVDKNPEGRVRLLWLFVRHRRAIHAACNQRKRFSRFKEVNISSRDLGVLRSNLPQSRDLIHHPESTPVSSN